MGIRYEAPGVAGMGLANLFDRRGGGSGGGGGGGGYSNSAGSVGAQQSALDLAGLQGTIESSQINQRGQIQGALQAQAAELDVWQFQQRVTEQEQAQLRQDQNSIAAIDADPTMSAVEKMQAKTRIKTRIDWTSERQKRDLQAAQVQMAQQHAQAYKMQAELDEERIRASTALATGKVKTMVRPASSEFVKKIVRDSGMPENDPNFLGEVDKVAAEMGMADTFAINEKGAIVGKPIWTAAQYPEGSGPTAPGSGARSSTGGQSEPGKVEGSDYKDAYEMGMKAAAAGGDKAATIKEYLEGIKAARGEADTPEKKKAKAKEIQQQAVGLVESRVQEVQGMKMANATEKEGITRLLNEMKRLTKEYKPGEVPDRIDKRLMQLDDQFKAFQEIMAMREQQKQGQSDRTQSTPPGGGPSFARAAAGTVATGLHPAIASQRQAAQQVGGAINRGLAGGAREAVERLAPLSHYFK